MAHLIFIVAALGLLAGFLALTAYEARRGTRLYAAQRARMDANIKRVEFILAHIDLAEFIRGELRHLASRVGHDIVHFSLLAVRSIERLLTRLVRRLRADPEVDAAPRETAREFVKTLSDFKDNLKVTHPEIPKISDKELD
ncbi:TPA: hypothetical protein DIV48_01710 [Candidatus Kaiserbacteria bacterium]|nr:MAG: hypothetical protein UY93_C0002G0091 [Parcubacteria group bacterium GW2011_GWA1_56_13]HCR52348.1 hypothetical protein [Candidatus Kaiserbacteria bacterium]